MNFRLTPFFTPQVGSEQLHKAQPFQEDLFSRSFQRSSPKVWKLARYALRRNRKRTVLERVKNQTLSSFSRELSLNFRPRPRVYNYRLNRPTPEPRMTAPLRFGSVDS